MNQLSYVWIDIINLKSCIILVNQKSG